MPLACAMVEYVAHSGPLNQYEGDKLPWMLTVTLVCR